MDGDDHSGIAAVLGDLVRAGRGIDYAAWCLDGQCRLEDTSRPAADQTTVAIRLTCRRLAEKLSFAVEDKLDRRLAGLGTGRLIRTVLATERGAVYCDQVVPGSYWIGMTLAAPEDGAARRDLTYSADEAIADRVEQYRDEIHGRRYDLGSWHSEHTRQELWANRARQPQPVAIPAAPATEPVVTGSAGLPAAQAVIGSVRPSDLQLVALFDSTGPQFCVDVLHDAAVRRTPRLERPPAPAERRQAYQELGVELPDYLRELARAARRAIGGPLTRAVLDTEDGAIYYRRLDASSYVVGLTVFQDQVFPAERRLDAVMDSWPR